MKQDGEMEYDETKPGNKALGAAKRAKKDEFYTQFVDVNNELQHYGRHFKGKVVLCNCDDPYESNFFQYFALRFNELGLKKLIATCYSGSPVAQRKLALFCAEDGEVDTRTAYKVEISEVSDVTGDGVVNLSDVKELLKNGKNVLSVLRGNGDFQNEECLELLKGADIVVTNPPFSLFREYVGKLVEYGKKFLIIGNKNAITYKEIFPLIKENKMWVGVTPMTKDMRFISPQAYIDELLRSGRKTGYVVQDGVYLTRSPSIWFTNLDHSKRHEPMMLMTMAENQRFSRHKDLEAKGAYQKYDNYDAIEVPYTDVIPSDYPGVMGVPITFLDKYCPEQFEIIGATESEGKGFSNGLWDATSGIAQPTINGVRRYKRLFIRAIQRDTST